MLKWRILVEDGRKRGHTFSQPDLIIAATALHYGLSIAIRNVVDFHGTGAIVHSPWVP
jgi:predicted nucleic acid-binding protein